MPNWTDMLNTATRSMVPRSAIRGLQEALAPGSSEESVGGLLDIPDALRDIAGNITEHPLDMLGGFASGAMEGMRGEVNPLNVAGLAMPGLLGAMRGASVADDLARPAIQYGRQAFDTVERIPPRQVMPSADDVSALTGDLQRNLAKVPSATGQIRRPGFQQPRNPMPAEFVPRGGETAFNAGRPRGGGPDINLPPNASPMSRGPRVPQPPPSPDQARRMGVPLAPLVDPVDENLARIEQALRERFSQMGGGYGRTR
jgi:hypothetical protein